MTSLKDIAEDSRYSVVKTSAKLTLFPLRLELPDDVRDSMALTQVKAIEGIRTLRFY